MASRPTASWLPPILLATLSWMAAAEAVEIGGTVREAGTGRALDGFVVTFPGATEPATVAADGSFRIDAPSLAAKLEVRSSTGVFFGTFVATGGRAAIEVQPSGVVWASDTGARVAGVKVQLLDATGVKAAAGTAAAGQQDQRTDKHGLYRFDLTKAGDWRLAVAADGLAFHFPSTRVPPLDGSAITDAKGFVDAAAEPAPAAPRAYWLSFKTTAQQLAAPLNNHLPVDRGGAVIAISKAASRTRAVAGDIVTYTIRVENRSGDDFPRTGGNGGVFVRDVLPAGLRLVGGSLHISVDGVSIKPAVPAEPQVLTFGESATPKPRGIELARGGRLYVRYQAVVGASVREGALLTNRALLVSPSGIALSDVAAVDLRIQGDALFDRSTVRGRVFCDEDGDGWAGANDPGVFGARVYIDTGRFAVTDSDGKFHLSNVPAGLHLVKVDPDTVSPGSTAVTEPSRTLHVSRGMAQQVSFGFRCATSPSGPTHVAPAGGTAPLAATDRIVVTGALDELAIAVDGKAVGRSGAARITIDGDPGGVAIPDVAWAPRTLPSPIRFRADAPPDTAHWRLWIEAASAQGRWRPVRALGAAGAPPAELDWDGTDGAGASLAAVRGALHRARLEVTDGAGSRVLSPPALFTVGWGRGNAVQTTSLTGLPLDRKTALDARGKAFVKKAAKLVKLASTPEVLVTASTLPAAEAVARALAAAAGIRAAQVGARTVAGPAQVTVEVFDASGRLPGPSPEREKPAPVVARIGGADVAIDDQGRFVSAPPRPSDGMLVIELRRKDGAVREVSLPVGDAATAGKPVQADLGARKLTVAGREVALALLDARVRLPFARLGLAAGKPEKPIVFALSGPPQGVSTWKLVVQGPTGQEAFTTSGAGDPPATVEWPGEGLDAGDYIYGLELGDDEGRTGFSPRRVLVLEAGPTDGAPGELVRAFRGKLLTGDQRLTPAFQRDLATLPGVLARRSQGERFLVEVHGPGDGDAGAAQRDTATAALRIRNVLVLKGVPEDRIGSVGLGNDRPLTAVKSGRDRDKNRRVEVRAIPRDGDGPAQRAFGLRVGGREVALTGGGKGAGRVTPAGGDIEVEVIGPHGERLVATVQPPEEAAEPAKRAPFGMSSLSEALARRREGQGPPPALAVAELKVELPPDGAELGQPLLPIRGSVPASASIEVTVNGQPVPSPGGRFELLLPLPNGERSAVVIEARDRAGNAARIERTYQVKGNALFLLALADGALTQTGTKLDGVSDDTSMRAGSVLLHGRGALYLKARVKGSDLLDTAHFTAYLDSARRAEAASFVDQVIDPERFYPIYGDGSDEHTDAKTRGWYYVAVETGRSKVIVGSIRTGIRGIELLRYDRMLEGAQLHFEKAFVPGWETVAELFVSTDQERVRRSQAALRGTGGSYYFLPDKDVIEGSEQVALAIYDRDTGGLIQSVPQVRDVDFDIDYAGGRLTFKKPIPSRVDASFLAGAADAISGRLAVDGHDVRILVDYETRTPRAVGDSTFGLYGRQSFGGKVSVGGGYVREGRAEGLGPDYELWGTDVRITPTHTTVIEAELAHSKAGNGGTQLSDDGGLSFRTIGARPEATREGWGIGVTAKTDVGEFMGAEAPLLELGASYRREERGFSSAHTALEQGTERGGGEARWHISRKTTLTLRHDTLKALAEDLTLNDGLRQRQRSLTSAQYAQRRGRFGWTLELQHSLEKDEGLETTHRGSAAGLVRYRVSPRVSLYAEQQVHLGGDDRIFRSTGDRLVTGAGIDVALLDDLGFTLGEEVRWSGEDATVIGLRTRLSKNATLTISERLVHPRDSSRWVPATVIGSEERWGEGGEGRSYGEYQVGTAASGSFNRAVLGVGRRFQLFPGLNADLAFERSHAVEVGGEGVDRDANTLSVGAEFVGHPAFKLTTRFEARFESSDHDRVQLVTFNRLAADLGKGLSLLGRADVAVTEDQDLDQREAETVELSLGLAYRPLDESFTLLMRAAHLVDMRPIALDEQGGSLRTTADVVSFEPIIELPLRFQLTPKFAWRYAVEEAEGQDEASSHTLLASLRLAFHLWQTLDLAGEYRWLNVMGAEQMEHGALAELAVNILGYARIGVGYNFSSFSDEVFSALSRDDHGFFVRLAGMY